MAKSRTWLINLTVAGSVNIEQTIEFDTEKELRLGEVFSSKIKLSKSLSGFQASVSVLAEEQESAHKIGLLFLGRMLDVLCIKINLPLFLSLDNNENQVKYGNSKVRCNIQKTGFYFFI